MQKNRWSRKFDWVTVTDSISGATYIQKDRGETYVENRYIAVGDIYFKLNKYKKFRCKRIDGLENLIGLQ